MLQRLLNNCRQQCLALLVALAKHPDTLAFKIDILDPQFYTFIQPQAAAVQDLSHQQLYPTQIAKQCFNFQLGENNRKPALSFCPYGILYVPKILF